MKVYTRKKLFGRRHFGPFYSKMYMLEKFGSSQGMCHVKAEADLVNPI